MERIKKKVLVIEQSPSLGLVIKTVLNESFLTKVVNNPFEAMDAMMENKISCIILGIDNKSGQAKVFLEHLKSSSLMKNIALIVLTDIKERDFKRMYGKNKVSRIFEKPFDPLKLLDTVIEVSEIKKDEEVVLRKIGLLSLN